MDKRLKQLRHEKGLTLFAVSQALGITMSALCNYEQGIREPSIDILKKLCVFYDVTSDYLIGLSDV